MLRIKARSSVEAAKRYYTELQRLDYYTEDQEIIGHWGGKVAERLGLEGRLEKEAFCNLCDNINPATGKRLTARTDKDRVVGYDISFGVPKSVSLVNVWRGDNKIEEILDRAARETMADIEKEMRTRVRKGGHQDATRPTGELISASFLHRTTRPVNGYPDPHLHWHFFVFNGTWDPVEKRFKAAHFGDIYKQMPDFQTEYFNRLSGYLREMGYGIRNTEFSFEIEGVPQSLIRKYSRRTEKIETFAREHGITSPEAKDALGEATRESKQKTLLMSALEKRWIHGATPEEAEAMERCCRPQLVPTATKRVSSYPPPEIGWAQKVEVRPLRELLGTSKLMPRLATEVAGGEEQARKRKPRPGDDAPPDGIGKREWDALNWAIEHEFHKNSVVPARRIRSSALRFKIGVTTIENMDAAMRRHPQLIFAKYGDHEFVTTTMILQEELSLIQWTREGMGTMPPLLEDAVFTNPQLTPEQQAALKLLAASRDRVTALEGRAGTGKTLVLKELVTALEKDHQRVLVLAPGSQAVNEVLKKRGFKNAHTVASLLYNERLQNEYHHGVWVVDEAGQLSNKDMMQLAELAELHGSRIVTSGDTMQHRGVERGDALRMLYGYAGLKPAVLTTIKRQTGSHGEAVRLMAEGDIPEAFAKLQEENCIQVLPEELRHRALANDYVRLFRDDQVVAVISPTHKEGREVTELIRERMKAQGLLREEREFSVYKKIETTPAERRDWRTYRRGMIVELTYNTPGTERHTRMVVHSVFDGPPGERGMVYLQKTDGSIHSSFVETYPQQLQLMREDVLKVAVGDKLRITQNGSSAWSDFGKEDLFNGTFYTVEGFDEFGNIVTSSGKVIPKDYGHFTHGFASTSYGAQGMTVDYVLVAEGEDSFTAASREQMYVTVGRSTRGVMIYTDNLDGLMHAVSKSSRRLTAVELTRILDEGPQEVLALDHAEELQKDQEWLEEIYPPLKEPPTGPDVVERAPEFAAELEIEEEELPERDELVERAAEFAADLKAQEEELAEELHEELEPEEIPEAKTPTKWWQEEAAPSAAPARPEVPKFEGWTLPPIKESLGQESVVPSVMYPLPEKPAVPGFQGWTLPPIVQEGPAAPSPTLDLSQAAKPEPDAETITPEPELSDPDDDLTPRMTM
ncbi:MAG TPA: MobF family relaxase [Phycisphaerae bacterium]|nr:MobF family relaxase [Phycisphaerae bacterium]